MKKALKTAPRGTAFNYAGQRWVVLEHNATGTLCLTEKIVEDRAFDDGNCNDFSKSSSLRYGRYRQEVHQNNRQHKRPLRPSRQGAPAGGHRRDLRARRRRR